MVLLVTSLSSFLQDHGGGDVPNKKFKKGKPNRWKGKQKQQQQQQQNGKGNQSTASDNRKGKKKKKPRIM